MRKQELGSGLNPRLQQIFVGFGLLALVYFMLTVAQMSTNAIVPVSQLSHVDTQREVSNQSMVPLDLYQYVTNKNASTHDATNMLPLELYQYIMRGNASGYNNNSDDNATCNCDSVIAITPEKNGAAANGAPQNPPAGKHKPKPQPKRKPPPPSKKQPKKKQPITIPEDIKKKLTANTVNGSLSSYSVELYEKATKAVSLINVAEGTKKVAGTLKVKYIAQHSHGLAKFVFNPNLTICKPSVSQETAMILFTTMFHAESKQYIFNNTLTNYALLRPKVQPVLFISDKTIIQLSGYLINRACDIGWTVLAAPRRTPFGFPILNTMYFSVLYLYPNVPWVGYANADILFTSQLPVVLEYVIKTPNMANFSFMSSRRSNVYLPPGKQLQTLAEVEQLANKPDVKLHSAMAIDLFFYKRGSPILNNMPDFCIGRRGYDNWLIFFQMFKKIPSLQITEVSKALHIGIAGTELKANSHATRRAEADYNINLADGPIWISAGSIGCLNNTLKYAPNDRNSFYVKQENVCQARWLGGTLVKRKTVASVKTAAASHRRL